MKSFDLAYEMKYVLADYHCSDSPSPEMLPSIMRRSLDSDYELDCTRFGGAMPSNSSESSLESQAGLSETPCETKTGRGLVKGWGSALSRSRCLNDLSSLGSASSDSSTSSKRRRTSYVAGPNATRDSWGYFVDTLSK